MNIIITGGTGLIGKALTANLISHEHQVTILSRNPASSRVPQGASVVKWDSHTADGWERQAAESQVIINLAGESIGEKRWTKAQRERIASSRKSSGNAVVEAITKSSARSSSMPKILVQASAVDYYGNPGDTELGERAPSGTTFLSQVCREWESSTQAVEALGIRRIVIRTGLVLSLAGGALPRILLPFKLFAGGPLGSGKQWYSWIHLHDEVEAIRFLIENDSTQGVYNLTAPEPLRNAAFGKAIARIFHRPYWIPVPAFALRLVLGEMSSLVLNGQKVLPTRLQKEGYQFQFGNIKDAFNNLKDYPM